MNLARYDFIFLLVDLVLSLMTNVIDSVWKSSDSIDQKLINLKELNSIK